MHSLSLNQTKPAVDSSLAVDNSFDTSHVMVLIARFFFLQKLVAN